MFGHVNNMILFDFAQLKKATHDKSVSNGFSFNVFSSGDFFLINTINDHISRFLCQRHQNIEMTSE